MNDRTFQLPPLEWIRAFETAARLGSFTAATIETGLTQPAISQRIAHLEAHLGTKLFLRQARTIALTVDGEAWLPHVQASLGVLRDSSEMLFAKGRRKLTISASQSVISLWLLPRLARATDATGAAISVQSFVLGGQSSIMDDVIQVRYGSGDWPHPYQVPLYRDVITPVAAPDYAARDWTSLPRIACTGPRPDWGDFTNRFGLSKLPMAHLRFDTFANACDAAKNGMGVTLGSLPLCAQDLASGALIRMSEDELENGQTYWMLASKSAVSARQWEKLVEVMTAPSGTG